MIAVMYCLIALIASLVSVDSRSLTASDVTSIKALITSTFGLEASYGTYCNAKVSPCTMGDNIGALVRLAFHDAAGGGGPNGCIDFTYTTANKGLENVVATLDTMYTANSLGSIISKADLYVLAANTAIEYATTEPTSRRRLQVGPPPDGTGGSTGAPPNPPSAAPTTFKSTLDTVPFTLHLPFRYGRVDSYSCNDRGFLPAANITWSQIYTLFGGRFGMSIKEVVAVMGGHSLGRCEWANSGFDGGWTTSQSSFSNTFYKTFGQEVWTNNNLSAVWLDAPDQTIMLMADVELLFSTNVHGQGSCNQFSGFTSNGFCPMQGQSSAAFIAYKNNITQFFHNFTTAWQKMTEYTYSTSLVYVGSTTSSVYPYLNGTLHPTAAPSAKPTVAPTNPTFAPSVAPTFSPTLQPSASSTNAPVAEATMSPTFNPTAAATNTPTETPTLAPIADSTPAPTFEPTFEPTPIPTIDTQSHAQTTDTPTDAPTAAVVATTSTPTFAPSEVAATAVPSEAPTTATPTQSPTNAVTISLVAYQVLQGMSYTTWMSDSNIALSFQQAVASACGHDIEYSDVTVTGVSDTTTSVHAALRVSGVSPLATSAATVTYTIERILMDVSDDTVTSVADSLLSSVNDGSFSSLLQSFGSNNGASSLSGGGVTASPNSLSFDATTDIPTEAPTLSPTLAPTSGSQSHSSGHSNTLSTGSIVAIVVCLGVAFMAAVTYMVYRKYYCNSDNGSAAAPTSEPVDPSTI